MRDFSRLLLAGICATAIALPAWAAAPKDAELLEEVPSPPKVIEGQPIDQPTVNKRKDGENDIE